jgi:hypothetical protein
MDSFLCSAHPAATIQSVLVVHPGTLVVWDEGHATTSLQVPALSKHGQCERGEIDNRVHY